MMGLEENFASFWTAKCNCSGASLLLETLLLKTLQGCLLHPKKTKTDANGKGARFTELRASKISKHNN